MRISVFTPRLLAVSLALTLTLPQPAWSLLAMTMRSEGGHSETVQGGLEDALLSSSNPTIQRLAQAVLAPANSSPFSILPSSLSGLESPLVPEALQILESVGSLKGYVIALLNNVIAVNHWNLEGAIQPDAIHMGDTATNYAQLHPNGLFYPPGAVSVARPVPFRWGNVPMSLQIESNGSVFLGYETTSANTAFTLEANTPYVISEIEHDAIEQLGAEWIQVQQIGDPPHPTSLPLLILPVQTERGIALYLNHLAHLSDSEEIVAANERPGPFPAVMRKEDLLAVQESLEPPLRHPLDQGEDGLFIGDITPSYGSRTRIRKIRIPTQLWEPGDTFPLYFAGLFSAIRLRESVSEFRFATAITTAEETLQSHLPPVRRRVLEPNQGFIIQKTSGISPDPSMEVYFIDNTGRGQQVSRDHADVRWDQEENNSHFIVTDHDSRNGTFLSNEWLRKYQVRLKNTADSERRDDPTTGLEYQTTALPRFGPAAATEIYGVKIPATGSGPLNWYSRMPGNSGEIPTGLLDILDTDGLRTLVPVPEGASLNGISVFIQAGVPITQQALEGILAAGAGIIPFGEEEAAVPAGQAGSEDIILLNVPAGTEERFVPLDQISTVINFIGTTAAAGLEYASDLAALVNVAEGQPGRFLRVGGIHHSRYQNRIVALDQST